MEEGWKPEMAPTSYEGSDDDDKIRVVSKISQNNNYYYNVVSDSKSDNEAKENIFDKSAKPPWLLSLQKWYMYNANKMVK